eukprot:gnl/MRDRNA2_/MRDRNA2_161202_c0_seq1.p1 gnl/MRDRNA2_/MRDRNA2_161202_c0~~gnl/MRDRNA2_/MRDRNA2_161202_c0_seq1.p1  ORF type:complete len:540 (-),score=68.35 gnl/MRDRNA2_/MRDRNA2_161202_c0_seq1:33-1580(-)
MSAFIIPYQTFRRTVMICFGVMFLTIHLNCEPFDNRSFFVLDQLETRNLRAFNSVLVVQLILDTVEFLRSDDGEPIGFPANVLLSSGFRGLLLLGVLAAHAMFISLAISTIAQEKFLKPNTFFLDHVSFLQGSVEPSRWRLFFQRFVTLRKMKYDETDTGTLDFRDLKVYEREYIMQSFGEFLKTSIVRFDHFHPISLAVTVRHAVERIYRHRAHVLSDLRQRLEEQSSEDYTFFKWIQSAMLEKTRQVSGQLDGSNTNKSSNTSPVFEDIDTSWIERFREEGFTAEELNSILNIMQSAGASDDLNYTSPTIRQDANTPQPIQKSPKNRSPENSKPFEAVMRSRSPSLPDKLVLPDERNCKSTQVNYELLKAVNERKDCIAPEIMDSIIGEFVEREQIDGAATARSVVTARQQRTPNWGTKSPLVKQLDLKPAKLHAKMELDVVESAMESTNAIRSSEAFDESPSSPDDTNSALKRRGVNAFAGSDSHGDHSASASSSSSHHFHKALSSALQPSI